MKHYYLELNSCRISMMIFNLWNRFKRDFQIIYLEIFFVKYGLICLYLNKNFKNIALIFIVIQSYSITGKYLLQKQLLNLTRK
jgi:hypothetical protein